MLGLAHASSAASDLGDAGASSMGLTRLASILLKHFRPKFIIL
jgi:hypothetical protein